MPLASAQGFAIAFAGSLDFADFLLPDRQAPWFVITMIYLFQDHALDVERRELRRGLDLVPVEPQVLDLLQYLIRNRDHVVSKDELIAAVWSGRIISESATAVALPLSVKP
jgi:DNA-binding winged helix-turn-helix (wHTH) protein